MRRYANRFAFIGHVQDLDQNIRPILSVLGLPDDGTGSVVPQRQHVDPQGQDHRLSPRAAEILRQELAADYDIYDALTELAAATHG